MSLWRYRAVPLKQAAGATAARGAPAPLRGELAGASARDVRAALRRVGLQVIDLQPVRARSARPATAPQSAQRRALPLLAALQRAVHSQWQEHQRRRRQQALAELYDGLATMLDSGMTLLDSIQTLLEARGGRRSAERAMLVQVREALRDGLSLSVALSRHPGWFDELELAMIRAAQHSGELPAALQQLAQRHQRAGELAQKLIGALAYPAAVSMVGLAVVLFLSTHTLPQLVVILEDNRIVIPSLTALLMGVGQLVISYWPIGLLMAALVAIGAVAARRAMQRSAAEPDGTLARTIMLRLQALTPLVVRRMAAAHICQRLAELLQTGVPLSEALRVLAPTVRQAALRSHLQLAAARIERGEEVAAALGDGVWFDAEVQRLMDVGQQTGALPALLVRIGERYQRSAERLIDRLARLLEPAVIVVLAGLVGIVVMAAILPLLRLQEVLS